LSGTKEYDYFPGEPAAKVSPSTTALPLGALAYPLLAIDSRESTSELGHRQLHGTATTEYLLQAPASTEAVGGIRVGAHGVKLWLDSRGRIKQVSYTEPLTTPASAAAGPRFVKSLYTETLTFSGFGETVNISMPTALDHR
jgi:hypothetical protein